MDNKVLSTVEKRNLAFLNTAKNGPQKKDILNKLESFKSRIKNADGTRGAKWMAKPLQFSVDSITAFKTDENKNRVLD